MIPILSSQVLSKKFNFSISVLSRHMNSQSEILKSDKAKRIASLCVSIFVSLFALFRFRFSDKANLKSERFSLLFACWQSELYPSWAQKTIRYGTQSTFDAFFRRA